MERILHLSPTFPALLKSEAMKQLTLTKMVNFFIPSKSSFFLFSFIPHKTRSVLVTQSEK